MNGRPRRAGYNLKDRDAEHSGVEASRPFRQAPRSFGEGSGVRFNEAGETSVLGLMRHMLSMTFCYKKTPMRQPLTRPV